VSYGQPTGPLVCFVAVVGSGSQQWKAGHFTPDDVVWRVQREAVLMLAGGRAFLMQAAHPLALAGFAEHSTYDTDPFDRLWRTMRTVWTAAFGSPEDAERAARRVKAMHGRVTGVLAQDAGPFPAGTPYAAEDPQLLMWVHATLYDSSLLAYETFVRPLTDAEHDEFYDQMNALARHWGTPDEVLPPDRHAFREYMDEMLGGGNIVVTDQAREMGSVILDPPAPMHVRAAWPMLNLLTAGLLPANLREGYGLRWSARRERAMRMQVATIRRGILPVLPRRARILPLARAGEARFRAGEPTSTTPSGA
jgi:uncharacterized protein (DUF2236 family)